MGEKKGVAPLEEEEKENLPPSLNGEKKPSKAVEFLADILRGVMIGIAFIIPGFSGGSVAAILGIYEKLVGAIADIFHQFKKSFLTLLPILLGMLLGIAALIYPIQLGLKHFPIPTVCLFVGLAVGGLPSVTEKIKGKPNWKNCLACLIPRAVAVSLVFLPTAQQEEGFLFHLNFGGYLLLILIGMVGSAALVVPGISGSMLHCRACVYGDRCADRPFRDFRNYEILFKKVSAGHLFCDIGLYRRVYSHCVLQNGAGGEYDVCHLADLSRLLDRGGRIADSGDRAFLFLFGDCPKKRKEKNILKA